ncbi:envelope stress response membrane protein PspC [Shewanella algae]|uniref:envelope stress response membrane protein PspC n=1 Tax=Shewanella algae TaxID=38313 RepID=UPI001183C8D2|nr:envelope stress response membrane protein PspC [Shewanella algae]TVL37393.1 phage shock protein C [Shewanella algae]
MTESGRRTLYRIPQQRKIAGVCAGVAEYFNLEPWLVRVVAASIFLLGGSGIVVIIYLLLWMILDVKPWTAKDTHKDIGVKKKVWQAGEPAKQALRDVSNRFQSLEHRLRALEQHVTSEQFELKRQINNL